MTSAQWKSQKLKFKNQKVGKVNSYPQSFALQMWTYWGWLLLSMLLMVIIFICCNTAPGFHIKKIKIYSSISFEDKIDTIKKHVVDLTDPSAVFERKEFIEIYENPVLYKDDVLKYISSKHDSDEKCIAIFSMAKLDVEDYVKLTEESYKLFQNKIISEQLLEYMIDFPFTKKQNFIDNYKNKNVRALLNKIKQDSTISEPFRKSIEGILNQTISERINRWYFNKNN